MNYINYYEIEMRRPDGTWKHAGNYCPKYKWKSNWLSRLVGRRPVIVNADQAARVARAYVFGALTRLRTRHPDAAFRVWEWWRCDSSRQLITKLAIWSS